MMTDQQFEHETGKHMDTVYMFLVQVMRDLKQRALMHDASKLKDPERAIFKEFTPKLKHSTYGSPEYQEFLKQMKVALDHHYTHNRHHPEYYPNGVADMTLVDLLEMLCDWRAAIERHEDGDMLKSIEHNTERFNLSPEMKQLLLNTVKYFGWDKKQ